MSDNATIADLRLVLLVAMAWLHHEDTGERATVLELGLDHRAVAEAIDRLTMADNVAMR